MYFWENNLQRALWFSKESHKIAIAGKPIIKTPSVIGAVIDLGFCLDFLDTEYLGLLKESFQNLAQSCKTLGVKLPVNKQVSRSKDLLLRRLDCVVIENLHLQRQLNNYKAFDSARGVFMEGEELYPMAGFNEKNHIQICIRNPNCIKGFFIPRSADNNFVIP